MAVECQAVHAGRCPTLQSSRPRARIRSLAAAHRDVIRTQKPRRNHPEHCLSSVNAVAARNCWSHLQIHGILHVMGKASAVRKSVQRYRERMRRAGFRLVQLWVPDTRAQGFAEECRRQSRAAARNKRAESEVMTWIEAHEDAEGWTP